MITLLTGDNSFEIHEALQQLTTAFQGQPERVDGSSLAIASLPDLLMGVSLFSTERLVIIDDLSTNSAVWEKLPDWLPRINSDIHVVLVDTKPDKRTSSYKALKEVADIREFPAWGERDTAKAEAWVLQRAKAEGLQLEAKAVRHLVQRVGFDQWQLARAIETLALVDEPNEQTIDEVIPANLSENIFQLFETALQGKPREAADMLATLLMHEDPYALFALLSSQVMTLGVVAFAEGDANPAKDFGIHPFVASKLSRSAKQLGKAKVAHILRRCADVDAGLKRSKGEPGLLLEQFLIETATLV